MAEIISSAPTSWHEKYTSPGSVAPGILPFKNVKVALIDLHHNIVYVDMNALLDMVHVCLEIFFVLC